MKFPKLVIEEANNLKKFATKKEIANLTLYNFNPNSQTRCIYGQMTGNCFSGRAHKLIKKSCRRVYKAAEDNENVHDGAKLNGKPEGSRALITGFSRVVYYYSPIEVFISTNQGIPEYAKKLIQFIKGEIKTL